MTDSAGGVGGGDSAGSMGGGSDVGGLGSGSSIGDGLSGNTSLSDSLTTGEQLAGSPTTEDGLKDTQTALGAALNSPTAIETLTDKAAKLQSKPENSAHSHVDSVAGIAGTVTTVSTSAVTAVATGVQQTSIQGPVEHAIERLEASKDPSQMSKAEALRDANRPGGLKGALHPDAVEYDVDKTMTARNQVLSDKSVIGNKLTNDLNKASKTIDMAESAAKKAGIIGTVAGPVIGSVSEIAKLDENATTAEQITAGIVGAVKTVDNAVVGGVSGTLIGLSTSMTGPGAFVTAATAGMAADKFYTSSGVDKEFDDFIDNTVSPAVQTGVEASLNAIDSTVEISSQVMNDIQESATDYYNDLFGDKNGKALP
ncbi:MAG: hypothetical protein ABW157_05950 [Candidatus Thiodiazotropha sp. LLP2]